MPAPQFRKNRLIARRLGSINVWAERTDFNNPAKRYREKQIPIHYCRFN